VNIKEYISSGIVQSYVLGQADPAERTEFERLCAQYPELVAEREAFEEALEHFALQNAVVPPRQVKDRFLEEVIYSTSINQSKVITMEQHSNAPDRKGNSGLRFLAAASIVLLIGSGWMAYKFYSQANDLKDFNKDLQARLDSTDGILNKIVDEQKLIKDPNVTVVNMVGSTNAPQSSANVFWDSASSAVYIMVKNMPKLPSDQQYQLWALIDGKPKDLGVFDSLQNNVILKMSNTQKAQAFAITIEKKGGNPSPNLEKLQSSGRTKAPL
jgi:anti-sigma-K factor RskA